MHKDTVIDSIAGVKVGDLAAEFGTPLYVYDAGTILARVREMKPFGRVRFAVKACSNIAILSLLRREDVVLDCVSEGELRRGLKAGFRPEQLVYTCDIFDESSLAFVIKHGIGINAGSIDMLSQYGPAAKQKEITVRINPGFGHGHSQKTNTGGPSSKHGIWHEDLPALLEVAGRSGLRITGLHMHIGSGTDLHHLAAVCQSLTEVARQIGPSLKMISGGGGLPIPYREEDERIDLKQYTSLWQDVRNELSAEFGHELELETEPGRYLVAEAGYLLSEIRAVKRMGENLFYVVDAGFNNLVRPSMYGAYHHISIAPKDGRAVTGHHKVIVAGPLCESGDVFTQVEGGYVAPRDLPDAKVGDYAVLHDAGAYGASMGSNYNSKPHSTEVLIVNGAPHLIRKRQSLDTLLDDELIPAACK